MTSANFNESFLQTDVLCVARYFDYVLAGIGGNLFVYSEQTLLLLERVFINERIHSIFIKKNLSLLKGGRWVSLVELSEPSVEFKCQIISKIQLSDWIQDVVMLENQVAGFVTAHNFFECWDLGKEKQLNVCSCEEKCILYSCKIVGDSLEGIILFSGTVCGEVLIWAPFLNENQPLQRLKSHNGAVFSIEVRPSKKLITTTSDDRSLKIWSVISSGPLLKASDWENSTIQLMHTLFGHTARVWRSLILPFFYLTIGEDSQLIVWNNDGKIVKTLSLHQEAGLRALDYSEVTNMITTGGEDGGINSFSLKHLIKENEAVNILNLGESVSTKVCFTNNGFVYTLKGECVLVSGEGKEVIYKSDNFESYCVLEVSLEANYIMMGSIKGHLVLIDSNKKIVLTEEKVVDGRIFSVHWLNPFILTCGAEGKLDLWEFCNGELKNASSMILPNCKERWTTCGIVEGEKLILGDRMGNVHVYDIRGNENPVKSFRKIHSYLGVTDLERDEEGCLSIGRDGTIKQFTKELIHSLTFRLPMEWPWKIVKYKDDILILGFRSVSFIIWSMKRQEIIASHECGGGHRSCDYKLEKNKLNFLYVKEKKIFTVDLILDGITRIREGFHGKEINCLKILRNRPTVIVTGSEDTTLRIVKIEKSELKQVQVFKAHTSSVRAVCVCGTDSKQLIVSVGGKGQIVFWDFDVDTRKCRELVSHRLGTVTGERTNLKSSTFAIDPETRIMCADIMKLKDYFLLVAGCSDRQIRIFSYNGVLRKLCAISYTHCILNVRILTAGLRKVLASMGTDGKVSFFDITDCSDVSQMGGFSLHQSGINSYSFEEVGYGEFILATGGDDNLISVAFVAINEREVDLKQIWRNSSIHSCQISGIKFLGSFLFTTSIDQRITIWKWSWKESEFKVEFLNQYMTMVPDIQGMDVVRLNDSTVLVAIHGKGLEILNVSVNSPSQETGQ